MEDSYITRGEGTERIDGLTHCSWLVLGVLHDKFVSLDGNWEMFDGRGRGVREERWDDTLVVILAIEFSLPPFVLLFSVPDLLQSRCSEDKPTTTAASFSQVTRFQLKLAKPIS